MDAAGTLHPSDGQPGDLSDREKMLAFERQWWRYAGAKERAIREQFGISAPRYYQALNNMVDRPEALAADPMLSSGCDGCGRAGSAPEPPAGLVSTRRRP
jgi:hypothetical protein